MFKLRLISLACVLFVAVNSSPQQRYRGSTGEQRYRGSEYDSERAYRGDGSSDQWYRGGDSSQQRVAGDDRYKEREYRRDEDRYYADSPQSSYNGRNPRPEKLHFVLSATNLPAGRNSRHESVNSYVKVRFGSLPTHSTRRGEDLQSLEDSEVFVNELNPKWIKVWEIQYTKGTNQKVWVQVREHGITGEGTVIGQAEIDLDEYVEHGHQLTVPISGTKSGQIVMQNTAPFKFTLELKSIPGLDEFGGLSDPYVLCYFRYGKDGRDYKFHETKTLDNTRTAVWNQPITFDNFQRGTDQMFHFVVKDADNISADDDIGEAFLDVEAFADKKQKSVLPISSYSNVTLYVKYVV